MLRRFSLAIGLLLSANLAAQTQPASRSPVSNAVPGRLIVFYRNRIVPSNAGQIAASAGARAAHHLRHLGISTLTVNPSDEANALVRLAANPQIALVLHDRYVTGHALQLNRTSLTVPLHAGPAAVNGTPSTSTRRAVSRVPLKPRHMSPESSGTSSSASNSPSSSMSGTKDGAPPPQIDTLYDSTQGWAVRAAGGYGDAVPGGNATGPWNATRGAGVRIAILDSGVDENHPDIGPNLVLNLSEVNQSALPSPCDDGSPQDQSGHGTWTASLAAGALGAGTGQIAGVAPQASILNIKVLERMPAAGIPDAQAACEAGQPGGLLSWVLQGIDDAVASHADVIALSLGTMVDVSTGEGAGWKSAFDQATYAATQSGAVIVAALGNDGLDLSSGTLVELPAESRGVLAITASTNPGCAQNLTAGATCAAGPVTRPYYSNYDPGLNAIAAPGGSYPEGAINATTGWIMGACSNGLANTTDGLPANGASFGCFNLGHAAYVQAMGTSASAALAAGAAAILRAARPDLTAAQIVAALRSSAAPMPDMQEPELNLAAAIATP